MGSLSSSSSTTAVKAQYDDNASYDVDGSASKNALFIEACRILIRREPKQVGGEGTSFTRPDYENELKEALAWRKAHVKAFRAGPDATLISFREGRR